MAKTFAQLKTQVALYLGSRTDLDTFTGDWINMAIKEIERGSFDFQNGTKMTHNFSGMRINKNSAIVSGAYYIVNPLPRCKEFVSTFILDAVGVRSRIDRKSFDYCTSRYSDLTNNIGRPVVFCEIPLTETLALSTGVTSDKTIASTVFDYVISDTVYSKIAAETALATGTIPSNKWGVYLFSIDNTGTITSTGAAANGTTGYDTELLAIAAIPALPEFNFSMGYVTIKTKVGSAFIAGTDSPKGGVTGNVASRTNFYITDSEPIQKILIRPTADTTYTFEAEGYQYSPDLDTTVYTSNYWTNNHWDIVLMGALLEGEAFNINDSRIGTWRTRWEQKLMSLIKAEKNSNLSGSTPVINTENALSSEYFNIDSLGG